MHNMYTNLPSGWQNHCQGFIFIAFFNRSGKLKWRYETLHIIRTATQIISRTPRKENPLKVDIRDYVDQARELHQHHREEPQRLSNSTLKDCGASLVTGLHQDLSERRLGLGITNLPTAMVRRTHRLPSETESVVEGIAKSTAKTSSPVNGTLS